MYFNSFTKFNNKECLWLVIFISRKIFLLFKLSDNILITSAAWFVNNEIHYWCFIVEKVKILPFGKFLKRNKSVNFRALIFELVGLQTFEVCLCISLVLTLVVARRQHSLGWISYLLPNWVTKSIMVELIFRSLWEKHLKIKKKKCHRGGAWWLGVTYSIHFLLQHIYFTLVIFA